MTTTLRDHFWWRPGWAPDRPYLTWHVLPTAPDRARASAVARSLAGTEHLAPVDEPWLHVTGPGVGFEDELPASFVATMVEAARAALADVPAFDAALLPPRVGDGGVYQELVHPRLHEVRARLRAAMRAAAATGPHEGRGTWRPPGADDEEFRPHLTLAYATGPAVRDDVVARLPSAREGTFRVAAAHLLALRMVPPGYRWQVRAVVALAEPALTSGR